MERTGDIDFVSVEAVLDGTIDVETAVCLALIGCNDKVATLKVFADTSV